MAQLNSEGVNMIHFLDKGVKLIKCDSLGVVKLSHTKTRWCNKNFEKLGRGHGPWLPLALPSLLI